MVSDRERIGVLHGQLKSTVQARVDEVVQAAGRRPTPLVTSWSVQACVDRGSE